MARLTEEEKERQRNERDVSVARKTFIAGCFLLPWLWIASLIHFRDRLFDRNAPPELRMCASRCARAFVSFARGTFRGDGERPCPPGSPLRPPSPHPPSLEPGAARHLGPLQAEGARTPSLSITTHLPDSPPSIPTQTSAAPPSAQSS